MTEFAGYDMPVQFSGINAEHQAVREGVGVFDVSHMGEITVKGPGSLEFIQHVSSNDASRLADGGIQYSCLPNGRGGIVDDILVYRMGAEDYLLVVNAANTDKDWEHLSGIAAQERFCGSVRLENISDNVCQLAVQGPGAGEIIREMFGDKAAALEYYTFGKFVHPVIGEVLVSATGYTGAGGFELYAPCAAADLLWSELWRTGGPRGLQNIGLGARDTLRLEKGYCLYGNDIDDTTSPIEAGLGWITRLADGKDLIDGELLGRQKSEGTARKLVGIKMIDKGIPRHGYEITDAEGNQVGHVTSGTMSPSLKTGIAMGYVPSALSAPGSRIGIPVRGRILSAEVVRLPFL